MRRLLLLPSFAALGALACVVAAPAAAQRRPQPGGTGTAGIRPGGQPAQGDSARTGAAAGAPDGARVGVRRPPAGLAESLRSIGVSGVVYDSLAGAPLVNATVQWAGEQDRARTYTASTDSAGRYRLPAVRLGRYLVGFFHPSVDALGVELPPSIVELRGDSAAQLDLGTPGAAVMLPALCGNNAPAPRPGSATAAEINALLRPRRVAGALLGTVRDADTGEPVTARVVLTWTELQAEGTGVRNVNRRLPVRVRPDGGFVACGLPSETDLVASADAPRRQSGLVEVRLAPGQLLRRDFTLGDSASVVTVTLPDTTAARENRLAIPLQVARGSARVSGVVRTSDGRPLAGARVSVAGTDVAGTTGPSGAFALTGLPAGTYSLEVRAIGYTPTRVAVNLSRARPAAVGVTIADRVTTLASVEVQADRSKLQKDFTGFLERQRRGMGRFFSESDIENRKPFVITDVLRMSPGMQVVPNGTGFGSAIRGRGNCTPDVYIDGLRVMDAAADLDNLVRPQEVGGVEVYMSAGTIPVQFQQGGGGNCGVVALWTKRGK